VLIQLSGNLADAEVKLQTMQVQFTGTAPDVQMQQAAVATIETAIATLVNNDLTLASRNLQNIDGMIGQFNAQLKNMPAESLQVIALTRASDTLGQIYQVLLQKQEDAAVSKAATVNNMRIVTAPELPLQAASPKPFITLAIGFFAGLFTGAAVTLGQLMLSGRFHSDEEIRRLVPLPVYGLIPLDATIEANPKRLSADLQSPFSEALRLLRSNLYRSATGQGARVVLLTSADVDDGKTTISVNLAKMLADDGKRVILVDADLHVGRLHEALRVDPSHGLTQWLTTHAKPWFQSVPGQRFMLLPAGVLPPNPSELLNDPFFADIMATLRAEFEYVIIDSPPLPAVSDGIALGQQADIILSVVMIEHTIRRAFAVHSEMLSALDRRQGIIINGVAANSYGYGYTSKNAAPPGTGMFRRARKLLGLAP
jgi:capsular exopolysaccharide synthesis family protein